MATSTEQLNDAIAALQGAADAYNGKKGEIDAALAASQAGYAVLSANLKGVVNGQMNFIATIDPDEAAPTGVDGGTFNTVAAAVAAAPNGSYCEIRLVAGKAHQIAANIDMMGRNIVLTKFGAGDNPVVEFVAVVSGGYNYMYSFNPRGGGSIAFYSCDLRLPTVEPDAALSWAFNRAMVMYTPGRCVDIAVDRCTVSGGVAGEKMGVAMLGVGASVQMGIYSSTLDGPFFAISGSGAKVITRSSVTLQNGAAIFEFGTVGTDILQH